MGSVVSEMSEVRETFFKPASLIPRLVLRKGDLYRLPAFSRGLEVVAGVAWVTIKERDIFLTAGERLLLSARREPVLVSALGHSPLIVEIFGAHLAPIQGALRWERIEA